MSQVFKSQRTTLNSCLTTFDNSVASDPKEACAYGANAQQCYSQPFMTACGQQAAWS
uniref:Uncharacterized protein n=1 Tax=Plectus sambesii TaxID=2011161 RepID=A0A914VM01_9BILA